MKVPEGIQSYLRLWCILLTTTVPASAATFDELLARAKAEAAAGHNWTPPGDNLTDTVIAMINLSDKATPEQLAELLALLQMHKIMSPPGKAGPAALEQDRTAADQIHAAAKSPTVKGTVETPTVDSGVALALPRSEPPIASHGLEMAPPSPHAAALSRRGQEAERSGDISGARRFYASAAELGDAVAALKVGRLYDPAFIEHNTVGGIDADPAQARFWYERAVALGNAEARPLLEALSVR